MGDKNIKKETKKLKKSDKKTPTISFSSEPIPVVTQPELIKKVKKQK